MTTREDLPICEVILGKSYPLVQKTLTPPVAPILGTVSISIRAATQQDIAPVTEILVEAFRQDPAFWRIVGNQPNSSELLRKLFTLQIEKFYLSSGVVDLAVSDDAGIVAAALWEKPDAIVPLSQRVSKAAGLVRLLGASTARALRRELQVDAYHPKFAHWYLYAIGTGSSARGKGAGSALLRHGIARAGDDPIYLESSAPRSASLYERHGFVPLGRIPNNDDLPAELAMWRPGVFAAQGR